MGTETGGMSKGKGVSWPVCLRTSSSGGRPTESMDISVANWS